MQKKDRQSSFRCSSSRNKRDSLIYLRPYFALTDGGRVGDVDVDEVEEVWRQTEAEDGVGQLEGVVRRLRELRRARLHLGEGLEHLPLRAVADRLPGQVRPVRHRDAVVGAIQVADACGQ